MTLHTYTSEPMSLPSINFLHLMVSETEPGQTFSNNIPTALKGCGVKMALVGHFRHQGLTGQASRSNVFWLERANISITTINHNESQLSFFSPDDTNNKPKIKQTHCSFFQGFMLLYFNKIDIHWCFQFEVKTADIRCNLSN